VQFCSLFVRQRTLRQFTASEHLCWNQGRKRHAQPQRRRSWGQAENEKRDIEDQLAGRTPEVKPEDGQRDVSVR
jgi:hypothetical protein